MVEGPADIDGSKAFQIVVHKMVHDLRGSVRALAELPDWAKEDCDDLGINLPDGIRETLSLISRHADRLNKTLDHLRIYAMTATTAGQNGGEEADIHRLLLEVKETLVLPRQCRLRWRIVGTPRVKAAGAVATVLRCVVENAVHHNPAAVRIAVGVRHDETGLQICVRDNGHGIACDKRLKVFEPMFHETRSDVPGIGMGLAIVNRIAKLHDGRAWVGETPPHRSGTMVCVHLKGV